MPYGTVFSLYTRAAECCVESDACVGGGSAFWVAWSTIDGRLFSAAAAAAAASPCALMCTVANKTRRRRRRRACGDDAYAIVIRV